MKIKNVILAVCLTILSGPGTAVWAQTPIGTADELAAIGRNEESLAGSYLLTADLTLENWIPVGGIEDKNGKGFCGTFDGGGHTVTITGFGDAGGGVAVGLFGVVEEGAVVKNLRVAGEAAYTATRMNLLNIGGIAAINRGSILCCRSDISLKGEIRIAGADENKDKKLLGMALPKKVVKGEKVKGMPDGVFGGGIVGVNMGTIADCYSCGSISVAGGMGATAGGIAGTNGYNVAGGVGISIGTGGMSVRATPGVVTEIDAIVNCYSTAAVSVGDENEAGVMYVAGGIVGNDAQTGKVSRCVALNRELTASGPVNIYASPILNSIGAMQLSFHSFYDQGMAISEYKKGKQQKTKVRKNAVALSATQEQSWWQYPDGVADDKMDEHFGFLFGSDETAPWVWDAEAKRPVLYWEAGTM